MNSDDKKAKILDIAMNLNRIGNWAADGYESRERRIKMFLDETERLINSLQPDSFSLPFKKTFGKFLNEYKILEEEGRDKPKDALLWAEGMMTWGNILTHRVKLINP